MDARMNVRAPEQVIRDFRQFKDRVGVKTDAAALEMLLKQSKGEGDAGLRWIQAEAQKQAIHDALHEQLRQNVSDLKACRKSRQHAQGKLGALIRGLRIQVPAEILAKMDLSKYQIVDDARSRPDLEADGFFNRLKENQGRKTKQETDSEARQ